MALEKVSSARSFGGEQAVWRHDSRETGTSMRFGLYLPPQAANGPVPVMLWLSGLTCTEDNFIVKAGAQRVAAELGLAIVAPDTSPRGLGYPGEDDAYDFGSGAGFYVDATEPPWSTGYRMASYVGRELPQLLAGFSELATERLAISGHSMGGHGALTLALRDPQRFVSVSAFSPICSPINCPWGVKALTGYLGPDRDAWQAYDACALVASRGWRGPALLVDQGSADNFLTEQLKPELLQAACRDAGVPLQLNLREGYDHSYFFIASFIDSHLRHHAAALSAAR
ncbi:MAG: S-formylglutathione hydrolase [Burkholderiaceae bacterium]